MRPRPRYPKASMTFSREAREIVDQIRERIQGCNVINLHQLPVESDPTGLRQLEKMLSESVEDLEIPLKERVRAEYFGEGPLACLLADETITEIIVNGPTSITFEKQGRLQNWSDSFLS